MPQPPENGARARAIEETALRAWPALTDSDFDGWRLRFADGYTRRANSVTPLDGSRLPVQDKIATCERLYAERGLPTIFRLTPFAPPELDQLLEERGYRLGERVEVQALPLGGAPVGRAGQEVGVQVATGGPAVYRNRLPAGNASGTPARPPGRVRALPVEPWLEIFDQLSRASLENRACHRAVLQAVPGVARLLAFYPASATRRGDTAPAPGGTVPAAACGMSVLLDGRMGLFDLITAGDQRNRGYGSELLRRALRWGERAGATEAYLQVLEGNVAAQRIYARLGFRTVYRYHYREWHGPRPR